MALIYSSTQVDAYFSRSGADRKYWVLWEVYLCVSAWVSVFGTAASALMLVLPMALQQKLPKHIHPSLGWSGVSSCCSVAAAAVEAAVAAAAKGAHEVKWRNRSWRIDQECISVSIYHWCLHSVVSACVCVCARRCLWMWSYVCVGLGPVSDSIVVCANETSRCEKKSAHRGSNVIHCERSYGGVPWDLKAAVWRQWNIAASEIAFWNDEKRVLLLKGLPIASDQSSAPVA